MASPRSVGKATASCLGLGAWLLSASMVGGFLVPSAAPQHQSAHSVWGSPSRGATAVPSSSSSPSALWGASAAASTESRGVSSLAIGLDPIGRIDANAVDLLDWVQKGRGEKHVGVTIANVAATTEGYYPDPEIGRWTLEATQHIPKGTVLVSIPNVLTLSPVRRKFKMPRGEAGASLRDALASRGLDVDGDLLKVLEGSGTDDKVQRVMDRFPTSYWRLKLAVLLVAERMKGHKSFWWPYLRNLPEKYASMPIFYNNSEFGSIQIPSLMKTVQSRCRMLVNISDGYLRTLKGTPDNPFTEDVHANDMGWGLCAASSRALRNVPGLTDRGQESPVMVPLIDLCQHSLDPNCHIRDYRESGGSVQLVASRDLSPGDMLTISYGKLSNCELLLDYGFTLPDNPYDRFEFLLSDDLIRASQRLMAFDTEAFGDKRVPGLIQPWQERVLTDLGLAPKVNGTPYWPQVKLWLGGEDKVDGRLLALLRVMYCRDRRLLALSNVTYASLQAYNTPFRIATFERRAIMHALGVAATLLRRLPTTLTEDWRLLTGQSLYISHDDVSKQVVFQSLKEGDSRDELMETVTTDEAVVKEYNPYREAELMERREPVIQYMGPSMNRCMREILAFRIAQKKILYRVISDTCHSMYGYGLVQSVQDMEELEEERRLLGNPEETARPANAANAGRKGASLDTILQWAANTFGEEAAGGL